MSEPLSPEHALRCGWVWGIAMAHGVDLNPILDDEDNYTDSFTLKSDRLPPGVTITLVVQPPEAPHE